MKIALQKVMGILMLLLTLISTSVFASTGTTFSSNPKDLPEFYKALFAQNPDLIRSNAPLFYGTNLKDLKITFSISSSIKKIRHAVPEAMYHSAAALIIKKISKNDASQYSQDCHAHGNYNYIYNGSKSSYEYIDYIDIMNEHRSIICELIDIVHNKKIKKNK